MYGQAGVSQMGTLAQNRADIDIQDSAFVDCDAAEFLVGDIVVGGGIAGNLVNLDAVDADAQAFLQETPAEFRIVSDPQGTLAREHDVIAMPTSYIFDRDGNLVTRHLGFKVKRQEEYEALLVETLNRQTE